MKPILLLALFAGTLSCRTVLVKPDRSRLPGPQPHTATGAPRALGTTMPPGSSAPATTATPDARPEIVALRTQAAAVLEEQAELYWQSWVFGRPLDLATAYCGHDSLFTPAAVRALRQAAAQSAGDDQRALTDLADYVAGEIVAKATAADAVRVDKLESTTTVTVDDEQHAWKDLAELIAGEPNAERRAHLFAAGLPLLSAIAPLVEDQTRRRDQAIRALGFRSAAAFAEELRGARLGSLLTLAQTTLDQTQALYVSTMNRLSMQDLALPLSKMRQSDLGRLMRFGGADGAFPAKAVASIARGVFTSLGTPIAGQKGLTLSSAAQAQKNPLPVCFPVDPPADVRVSLVPTGGLEYLRELLHELAHAELYLHERQPRWELRILGGDVSVEATALLFSDLADDPAFLRTAAGMKGPKLEDLVRRGNARRLLGIRRAAARVEFEVARLEDRAAHPAELYRRLMSRALGFALTADESRRWVIDRSELAGSADDLRAALAAVQLERAFEQRFGATWWRSKAAGALLQSIWSRGTQPTVDELLGFVGEKAVSPDALVSTLTERLWGAPGGARP